MSLKKQLLELKKDFVPANVVRSGYPKCEHMQILMPYWFSLFCQGTKRGWPSHFGGYLSPGWCDPIQNWMEMGNVKPNRKWPRTSAWFVYLILILKLKHRIETINGRRKQEPPFNTKIFCLRRPIGKNIIKLFCSKNYRFWISQK